MAEKRGFSIKLSACMMVKDEEEHLPCCLGSIEDFIDEIVVVDTGSTDETIAIAKSYGAKVYHHPWEGDFSKHRNQSISYATGNWILIIDADEELFFNESSTAKFKEFLANVPEETPAVAILLKDMQQGRMVMKMNTIRFFRRGKAKYQGIVHNQPILDGKRALFCEDIILHHYGYDLSPERSIVKTNRTRDLLFRQLAQNPDDDFAIFHLAQHYTSLRDWPKGIEYCERYLSLKEKVDSGNFNLSIYFTATRCCMRTGDRGRAWEWLEMAMKELPEDLDISLALVEYGVWTERKDLIVVGANQFVNLYKSFQEDAFMRGNRLIYSNTPEAMLYCLYHQTIAQLSDGFVALDKLTKILPETREEYSDGIMKDLEEELKPYGIKFKDKVSCNS